MAESPRRVELRLTIPARTPFRELAAELVTKFAEMVGADASRAKSIGQEALAAVPPVAQTQSDTSVDVEVAATPDELIVTDTAGKKTTYSLPD